MCCVLEGPGQVTRSQSHRSLGALKNRELLGLLSRLLTRRLACERKRQEAGCKRGWCQDRWPQGTVGEEQTGAPAGLARSLQRGRRGRLRVRDWCALALVSTGPLRWPGCEQTGQGQRGRWASVRRPRAPRKVCRRGPGRCGFQVRIKTTWTEQANILDAGCEQKHTARKTLQGAYLPKRRGSPSSEARDGSSGGTKVKTEKRGRDTVWECHVFNWRWDQPERGAVWTKQSAGWNHGHSCKDLQRPKRPEGAGRWGLGQPLAFTTGLPSRSTSLRTPICHLLEFSKAAYRMNFPRPNCSYRHLHPTCWWLTMYLV